MTPADHYHNKDCTNLFNLNNYHNINSSNNFNTSGSGNINTNNNNSNNSTTSNNMGGQTPVYFAPSSFIVAGHKPSQDLHEAMLASKQLSTRGPLQLVDFKDVVGVGGGSGGGEGGNGGEQMRNMGKRPQLRYMNGNREYDPGPGSAGSTGEEMSMEYIDHMEGGEYMDHMEGGVGELVKKGSRRLGYDQVKALEKAFEIENRLEPERKVRLASQLGLQPRQVAVWFQNRRARWKTKQMERDYTLLKNKFEALKADRDKLLQEKDHLQAELTRLKGHAVMEGVMSKKGAKGEQDSPTLASGSLVDDAPAKQGGASHHHEEENGEDHIEEEEELEEEEEEASPSKIHVIEQKLLDVQNDSLSSTEDSDINNDGAIVNSTSKAFHEEPDYYAQHWRLPPAPTQLIYKPSSIKNEEWPEQGEHMSSFNMPIDTNWYNW